MEELRGCERGSFFVAFKATFWQLVTSRNQLNHELFSGLTLNFFHG